MKKIIIFILAMFCFSFFAPQIKSQSLLKGGKIPKDLIIKLTRTVCFGTCPDYQLTIKSNGNVSFKGGRFTQTKGIAKATITQTNLKIIISEFEKANFFSLKNSYSETSDGCGEVATDNPSEIISIQINGKKKNVSHYFGCRMVAGNMLEKIINLGNKIDEIVETSRWIGKNN